MDFKLDGKVAIVTGAGSSPEATGAGIGEAIATVLAKSGAAVLLVDRAPDRAEVTLSKLQGARGPAATFDGDIAVGGDCETMVSFAVERFGGLDILVNNAAIAKHMALTQTSDEVYDETLAINLKGTFLACRAAMPALISRGGGSIVNIGSIAGIRDAGTAQTAYAASKAGQIGLTIELAGTHGRDNVRVNAVLPGLVATPMQQSSGQISDDIRGRLNLLGRLGDAWDVAHTVAFLCSDEASYLTGLTIPVDGGATVGMPASAFRRPAATN